MEQIPYRPEGLNWPKEENRRALSSALELERAFQNGRILEARACLCDEEHRLHVDLGCMEGIIERNECALGIEEGTVRDVAIIPRVGKPVCFKIIGFSFQADGRPIALLSRRAAQEECIVRYIQYLTPGQIVEARVTHLEPFGCFTDIGCGVVALLPIDCISVSRIAHPRDRFAVGQMIRAVIKSTEGGKITLTHKELLGTWEENAALFTPGQTAAGIVRSVEPYGIFVELTPNLSGLAEVKENVEPGQHASVYIKNIIPRRMKVKLIIVDSFSAPSSLPPQPEYFTREESLTRWRYSPEASDKLIETNFL